MKLVTTIDYDAALLPHFLHHYTNLGITRFLIGVYEHDGLIELVSELARNHDVYLTKIPGGFEVLKDLKTRRSLCRHFIGHNEWWAVADLDEFHQYPLPLHILVPRLERAGFSYLQSQFLDRISADGSCPQLRHDLGLWEQFPAGAYVTRDLLQAIPSKLLLVRGDSPIGSGHHHPAHEATGFVKRGGIVHHFKWFGDVVRNARKRIATLRRTDSRSYRKYGNLLHFWNEHNRLPAAGEFGFHFPEKPRHWSGWPEHQKCLRQHHQIPIPGD